MKLSNLLLGLTGCFFAASLSGCFVVTSDTPPPADTGSLTVELSLDGKASASECDYFHIDTLRVDVLEDGASVISADSDCYDLGMTIDNILPGRYTVKASLFEGSAIASNIIAVDNTPVSRDIDSVVKIDFPAKWIY